MIKVRKIEIIDSSQKKKGLNKKKLNNILLKWQKRLMLDNWNIVIQIVDFKRTDYRQSGDFKADFKNKRAVIYLTCDPFLRNQKTIEKQEEQTIVHELVHIVLWSMDSFIEKIILKNCKEYESNHDLYLEKLEETVDKLTLAFLKKEKG